MPTPPEAGGFSHVEGQVNAVVATWIDDLERELLPGETDGGYATPGQLAQSLDDRTVQTRALDLIDQALADLAATPDGRLIVVMPPQEGKSQRCSRWFPTWMLKRNPDTRIAIASAEHKLARKMGRQVRDDVREHGAALGLAVRRDLSGQAEWQLAGYEGGVFAVGIGGGLTGRPVDLLIIDDPIKNRDQADSKDYRDKVWDWWTDVASTRLAPGAPVVLILTRWHEDDLAGRLLAAEDGHRWKVLRIPAQADHDLEKGETDPLDREFGQYLESARGRTEQQWAAIKVNAGSRTWGALYQGRPAAADGEIFKRFWWRRYEQPLWVVTDDGQRLVTAPDAELIQSWDLAFKDTKTSDFVVGQVWLRIGVSAYLVDQIRGRMDFVASCAAVRTMTARWPQSILKIVEAKANGPALMAALGNTIPGLVPEEPQGSKQARAYAVTPLIEAGNVFLPADKIAPWIDDYIEECAGFPNGANDDQVDATTQALNRLLIQPLVGGGDEDVFDEYDVVDLRGYYGSPV